MKKGIGRKIVWPAIIGLILLALLIGVVTLRSVREGTQRMALEKARSDLATIYEIIDNKFPGSWSIQGSSLCKGETIFNDYNDLVDWLELTGNTVTIFQNDRRVATNVITEGTRATGTKASAEVVQEVLNARQEYVGEALVWANSIKQRIVHSWIRTAKPWVCSIQVLLRPWSMRLSESF